LKKIIGTAALTAAAVLLVTGCAASPKAAAPAPSSPPAVAAVSQIPKPDAAQAASLRSELAKINPLLDNDKAVDNARNQCSSILGDAPADRLIASAKARFTGGQVKSVSDAEAQKINAVIKANGFCKA
jgi:hypothetical protein